MHGAMRARSYVHVLFVLLFTAAGCGGGSTVTETDASGDRDAATSDAGRNDGGALADAATTDSGSADDAGTADDAATPDDAATIDDAGSAAVDAGTDAFTANDTGATRRNILPDFCPSTPTAAGLYRGTLAGNTNDVSSASGTDCLVTAPGRDGSLRVHLEPGQTLTARYRHDGDGVLYVLDRCPVTSSCLVGADASSSGEETVTWTNTDAAANDVYLFLDSTSLGAPQTFELDLEITP